MSGHRILHDILQAPFAIPAPANGATLTIDRQDMVVPVASTAAWAITIAQPTKAGVRCMVVLDTDGGDLTLTVTGGYNADGDTTITFADAGDFVILASIKVGASYYWRVIAHEGTNAAVEDITVDQLTATTAEIATLNAPTVAAEHGPGAIGTAGAPVTSRRIENGTIITETKIDLTGLTSKNTANDVIGLATGGAAYIGRNVAAKNGIIYKAELICVETPAGGDNDVNVVANAAADLAYDGAGGTAYGVDGGDAVAGQVIQDLTQSLTANHYFYLTAGTGDTAAAYTAGQFIFRTYGHALLN